MVQISKADVALGVASLFVGGAIAYGFSRTRLSRVFMAFGLAPPAIAAAIVAVKVGHSRETITLKDLPDVTQRDGEEDPDYHERLTAAFAGLPGVNKERLRQHATKIPGRIPAVNHYCWLCGGDPKLTLLLNRDWLEPKLAASTDLLQTLGEIHQMVLEDRMQEIKRLSPDLIDPTFVLSGDLRLYNRELCYLKACLDEVQWEKGLFLFACQHPEVPDAEISACHDQIQEAARRLEANRAKELTTLDRGCSHDFETIDVGRIHITLSKQIVTVQKRTLASQSGLMVS